MATAIQKLAMKTPGKEAVAMEVRLTVSSSFYSRGNGVYADADSFDFFAFRHLRML